MSLYRAGPELKRTASRITYRFQSHDIKVFYFEHVVKRMRAAAVRAGGELYGGIQNLPRKIQRWTLLRSPHVNKKSREKFWVVNRLRLFRWDAPAHMDPEVPRIISESVPASVAVRTIVNDPGLRSLKSVFDTIHAVNSQSVGKLSQPETETETETEAQDEKGSDSNDKGIQKQ